MNANKLNELSTTKLMVVVLTFLSATLVTNYCWAQKGGKGGGGSSPAYTIIKLSDANGAYTDGVALNINNFGRVVGEVNDGPIVRAAYWQLSGSGANTQSALSLLSGGSVANGINDFGEIVGAGVDGNGNGVAMFWSAPGSNPIVLPPLPLHDESFALAINNDGVICGYSNIRGGQHRAAAWRINMVDGNPVVSGPIALPDLGTTSRAYSINNNDASGVASIAGLDDVTAVIWGVQSLGDGSLAVAPAPVVLDQSAVANGINDSSSACGYFYANATEAVVWTGSSSRILNRDKWVAWAYANDINNNGIIVGTGYYRRNFDEGHRAVVWRSSTSSMILLDQFLASSSPFNRLVQATAVNDWGQIVGYGWMGSAGHGGFVAMPK